VHTIPSSVTATLSYPPSYI